MPRKDVVHEVRKFLERAADTEEDPEDVQAMLAAAIWPAHDGTWRRAAELVLPDLLLPAQSAPLHREGRVNGGRSVTFIRQFGLEIQVQGTAAARTSPRHCIRYPVLLWRAFRF